MKDRLTIKIPKIRKEGAISYMVMGGKTVNALAPDTDLETIAHSLSQVCSFNGHTQPFWSTAQHCLLVAHLSPPEYELHALLHDAGEPYGFDAPTPYKAAGRVDIKDVEDAALADIYAKLGAELPDGDATIAIDQADAKAASLEMLALMYRTWKPEPGGEMRRLMKLGRRQAKTEWLKRVRETASHAKG